MSTGWGADQFRRIAELAGRGVEFQTLPVLRYDNVDGQDVNVVDAAAIKAQVTSAFEGGPPDDTFTSTTIVDVINAGGTPGLAATVSEALHARGYGAGEVRNASSDEPIDTAVDVGAGADSRDANWPPCSDSPSNRRPTPPCQPGTSGSCSARTTSLRLPCWTPRPRRATLPRRRPRPGAAHQQRSNPVRRLTMAVHIWASAALLEGFLD